MKISSTLTSHTPSNQPVIRQAAEPPKPPTFLETFQSSVAEQLPAAMTYSAVAGAALAVAATTMGIQPLASMAQSVAVSAAAGAGVGLASGLLVSAFKAATVEPEQAPEEPAPVEPEPQPPVEPSPSPEETFVTDMKRAESILDRRVNSLASLVQAERNYTDSRGRSGLGGIDQARMLLDAAEQDLAELNKERAQVVKLEEELELATARLQGVRSQQQRVLDLNLKADGVVQDSIGRTGRRSQRAAKQVFQELEQEVARLKKALRRG